MSVEHALADFLEANLGRFAKHTGELLRQIPNSPYPKLSDAELIPRMQKPFVATISALRGDLQALIDFSRQSIKPVVDNPNASSDIVAQIGEAIYSTLKVAARECFADDELNYALALAAAAEVTFISNKNSYQAFVDIREARIREREETLQQMTSELDQANAALRELAAPIAPIHDNILVLPLVGSIDTNRAQMLTEDLLEQIVARQSDIVIMDITGVPIVDTNIANYLVQTTKAVSLLGAQVILVGISAEVAQTIVGLEIDLRQLSVRANLQDGIEYALEQVGLGIRPLQEQRRG
ncbi:STAS domain-containing protein [Herpetosiphon sp.]|uniref:Anti-sigma-factor antagonist n=1 Tax=Herpetosiphon aurantiacus (strain ATCC 23779 / DSM 785 / 114-95) TaxID=316274 RepID=A9B325_HERA2|nr:STAS domain-containing protein [Herpetosiphon sp.]ABX07488.1 anti-sigma-factor antagonist [Herpetosiphon aurantiacus DSM 785]